MNLRAYFNPLLRWWWLILLACLAAGGASYLAVRKQPAVYQARTTLIVGRAVYELNPSSNELVLNQQLARFYADIAQRQHVREATLAALGLDWLPSYQVRSLPSSQFIEILVADTNPFRAQAVANELANQLVLQSPTSTQRQEAEHQAFANQQLDALKAAITETEAEITRREAELLDLNSASGIAQAQQEIDSLRSKLSGLQANYAALLATSERGALNTLTIIEPAALPTTPVGPDSATVILLATAIAFGIAVGSAYLIEYMDDTLKSPDDTLRVLDLPTLGLIERLPGQDYREKLVAAKQPLLPAVDAFRMLRTNLQFSSIDAPARTLMLTSPGPAEGKSLVLANLAVVMAQAGLKVIVVDCDLRRPTLHKIFGLSNSPGLIDAILRPRPNAAANVRSVGVTNLGVLTGGMLPPNPAEILGSERMKAVIAELQAAADIVLFDSPPVLVLADAAILATQVDAVLVLADTGRTRTSEARQAVERLRRLRVNVLGMVLNRQAARHRRYAYYYDSVEPPKPRASARAGDHEPAMPDKPSSESIVP